ncbi:hypothetical protein IC582_020070 [Cucumis melo]
MSLRGQGNCCCVRFRYSILSLPSEWSKLPSQSSSDGRKAAVSIHG